MNKKRYTEAMMGNVREVRKSSVFVTSNANFQGFLCFINHLKITNI